MLHNCTAEIKRFVYVNKKAKTRTSIGCYSAYITALSEESSIVEVGKFGKAFKLSLTQEADIKESDLIVINNVKYTCKGVSHRRMGTLVLTTAILELGT